MLVALLAIAVGATILSGLVTIYYDVPRQMGEQVVKPAKIAFHAADEAGKEALLDLLAEEPETEEVIRGIEAFMEEQGIRSLDEIRKIL